MVKKTHRLRVLLVAFVSLAVFVGLETRLYYVQIVQHDAYARKANSQQYLVEKLYPKRGDILDREGQTLATSTTFQAIYFCPRSEPGDAGAELPAWRKALTPELVHDLSALIGASDGHVQKVLSKSYRYRLKNMVPPETTRAVRLLLSEHQVPSDLFELEEQGKRLYPKDELVAPVIGIAGINEYGENIGREGLEYYYDKRLSGQPTQQRLQTTNRHGELEALDDQMLRKAFGNSIVLTIDSQVQRAAREALRTQMERTKAKSGVVVVMDVETGAMRAMVSLPDFNPNAGRTAESASMRNRALTDPIEIGSVMKILTTAILLDNNLLNVDEMIDCHNGYAVIDGRVFRDSHDLGVVPFRLAFADSSNIGLATVGLRLEPTLYYDSLCRFGLGAPVGIDLPGEGTGILRPVSQWTRMSRTSLPVGYETSLTALQVVTAVAAIANKGIRMQPRVVSKVISIEGRTIEDFPPKAVVRVAGEETCNTLLDLMREVVNEGTGKKARVPGYSVAGKTGTTRKQLPGRRYIASFAGIIPANNPKLAIYCFVDEPDPKIDFYGGSVSAPVFAEVARESVRILGIPPDMPETLLAENAEDSEDDSEAPKQVASVDPPKSVKSLRLEEAALRESEEMDGVGEVEAATAEEKPESEGSGAESVAWATEPAYAEVNANIEEGLMPNCLGLTMAEVVDRTAGMNLPIKLVGSGIAIQQTPPPGTSIVPGRRAMIVFAAPSQALASGDLGELKTPGDESAAAETP